MALFFDVLMLTKITTGWTLRKKNIWLIKYSTEYHVTCDKGGETFNRWQARGTEYMYEASGRRRESGVRQMTIKFDFAPD